MGLEALAGIGWVDVTALGSIVGHQPLEHACETAACKGWWPMNASVTGPSWHAGKAVNASRFPCASPSGKAEGSADL